MAMTEAEAQAKMAELTKTLPQGYVVSMVANYPQPKIDRKTGKEYTWSVSLLNTEIMDMPRGVGNDMDEAFKMAVENIMGDDGLSKAFRDILQGPKH